MSKIKTIEAYPSDDGDWFRVHADGIITHYVHKCRLPGLIADLESSGHSIYDIVPTQSTYVEFKIFSMFIIGRPQEFVTIDCLRIAMLSRDVSLMLEYVAHLQEQKFRDSKKFYKLESDTCSIVFTPDQAEIFAAALGTLVTRAEERDKKFIEEWKAKVDKKNEDS